MNPFRNNMELWIGMSCCSAALGFFGWERGGSIESFLLNISTEIIGILVTVILVEQVRQQQERQRLAPFRSQMVDDTVMAMNSVVDVAGRLIGEEEVFLGLLVRDGQPNRRIDEASAKTEVLSESLPSRQQIDRVEDFMTLRPLQLTMISLTEQLRKIKYSSILDPEDLLPVHHLQRKATSIASDLESLLESPPPYSESCNTREIFLNQIERSFQREFVEFLKRMQDMYRRFESDSSDLISDANAHQKCRVSVVVSILVMMVCFMAVVSPENSTRPQNVVSRFDSYKDNWTEQEIGLLESLLQSVKSRQKMPDSNKRE